MVSPFQGLAAGQEAMVSLRRSLSTPVGEMVGGRTRGLWRGNEALKPTGY
jgi:hypothetical protein